MSKQAIHNYYNKISQFQRFGGSHNESNIRRAFANLLDEYCTAKNRTLVDEVKLKNTSMRPDGTIKDSHTLEYGYWESKDAKDNLDQEIQKKMELGYPTFNILFENSVHIVLIQKGAEVMRGSMSDADFLHRIISQFVEYVRPEIVEFHAAVEKFKEDIPYIVEALRKMIAEQESNPQFVQQRETFWNVCRESINPEITAFDIREMLIQHILTAEIFDTVFGQSHFHRENNIAQELEKVINTFFTGKLRQNTLASIDNYYKAIKAEAARIANHYEKQTFLKVIYENFYKAYNPKGADRLGVVYTPNEIVKFMVESTDFLLEKHFAKSLADKNVQILDPATGTGTFITEIIEHIPPQYLKHKYINEIHCNELAILPYYIANLNIEFTYQQKMQEYEPFENIVFVDTLDNLGFSFLGKHEEFEGFGISTENLERIKKQNSEKISVIIGNPPYNAKQLNYNDFNANKKYTKIDERIKLSYSKLGTAQNKNQIYDMYFRFFRWATDRINGNGIVSFITNHSFIHTTAFDGFRKSVEKEFDYIYIVDLGGDIRNKNTALPTGNVFNIITGVAITFLIRVKNNKPDRCLISYLKISDELNKAEKLEFLIENKFKNMVFDKIETSETSKFWINQLNVNTEALLPMIDKEAKATKNGKNAIFKLFSGGNKSQRDEWVYDFSEKQLQKKIKYFIEIYRKSLKNKNFEERNSIKWDRELSKYAERGLKIKFDAKSIIISTYRPFTKKKFYFDQRLNGRTYQWFNIPLENNKIIGFISGVTKPFSVLATDTMMDLNSLSPAAGGAQCLPLYRFDKQGNRTENITDWGLEQFRNHYSQRSENLITKEDIFYYTYAVLHHSAYRKKYELNLKREFPLLPFYSDFWKWAAWGKQLMDLHIDFEAVEPYSLQISENLKPSEIPKPKLKANTETGEIYIDENSTVSGIPPLAWEYKLGNRSAIEWILDQYKEKIPTDTTIKEKFNAYCFADYKETVIDLIQRITTVSVRTMEIVKCMEGEEC